MASLQDLNDENCEGAVMAANKRFSVSIVFRYDMLEFGEEVCPCDCASLCLHGSQKASEDICIHDGDKELCTFFIIMCTHNIMIYFA